MRLRSAAALAAGIVLGSGFADTASAAGLITGTFTGIIDNSGGNLAYPADNANEFGLGAGTDLTGKTINGIFSIDPAGGADRFKISVTIDGIHFVSINPSLPITESLFNLDIAGPGGNEFFNLSESSAFDNSSTNQNPITIRNDIISFAFYDVLDEYTPGGSLPTQSFVWVDNDLNDDVFQIGTGIVRLYDITYDRFTQDIISQQNVEAGFRVLQVTVVVPDAVPEPGAMALFGTGLLGMALVRHRRRAP